MIARICALAALTAVLCAVHANSSSAAAATAASACSHPAAFSHRSQALRSLSSAETSTLKMYCKQAKQSAYKLKFWYSPHNRWTLYPNQSDKKCWQAKLTGPARLCLLARAEVRVYGQKLETLNRKIEEMTRPRLAPALLAAFECIHGKEGAWNSNTGNGYYGGLQMDIKFQELYGNEFLRMWGTADNWPIWAQLEAARRAYVSGRGLAPWPKTHVACGLPTYLEV